MVVAGPRRGGAATYGWSDRARLPMRRSEVAAVDGYLFVVGGFAPDGDQRTLLAYDVRSDRWQRRSPLPRGLNHPGWLRWPAACSSSAGSRRKMAARLATRMLMNPRGQMVTRCPIPVTLGSSGRVGYVRSLRYARRRRG
ncbi:MAG: hypothetical protein GIX01_02355 [Candidatus Eremiobacteraeota bacterium]|nr:hypothetical protein [Candidatus Eremiobacteraeota bacterium]